MLLIVFRSRATFLEVLEFRLGGVQEDVGLVPANAVGFGFPFEGSRKVM